MPDDIYAAREVTTTATIDATTNSTDPTTTYYQPAEFTTALGDTLRTRTTAAYPDITYETTHIEAPWGANAIPVYNTNSPYAEPPHRFADPVKRELCYDGKDGLLGIYAGESIYAYSESTLKNKIKEMIKDLLENEIHVVGKLPSENTSHFEDQFSGA